MEIRISLERRHLAYLVFTLALLIGINYAIGYGGTEPTLLGHSPSEIGPGTFAGGGNYIFPSDSDLQVEGNMDVEGNIDAGNLNVFGSLDANNIGSVFIHWGNGEAPPGTELLYNGFGFSEHYTHSGGSAKAICLKLNPDSGESIPGGSYGDLLYPVGTGGGHVPTTIPTQKEIKCAVVYANGPVFTIWGTRSCPSGWTAAYTGYGMGAYYSHTHQNGPYCVDDVDFDASVDNPNWGEIWYGTALWDNADVGGHGYETGTFVQCAVCIKE